MAHGDATGLTRPGATARILRVMACQYIAGDPLNGGEKCGRPVIDDSAYCREHDRRCKLGGAPAASIIPRTRMQTATRRRETLRVPSGPKGGKMAGSYRIGVEAGCNGARVGFLDKVGSDAKAVDRVTVASRGREDHHAARRRGGRHGRRGGAGFGTGYQRGCCNANQAGARGTDNSDYRSVVPLRRWGSR